MVSTTRLVVWSRVDYYFRMLRDSGCLGLASRPNRRTTTFGHRAVRVERGLQCALEHAVFYLQRPDWALWEVGFLWASILLLIVYFWSWSRRSAHLLMPYLAWVTFASVLNIAIVRLNAPFLGRG